MGRVLYSTLGNGNWLNLAKQIITGPLQNNTQDSMMKMHTITILIRSEMYLKNCSLATRNYGYIIISEITESPQKLWSWVLQKKVWNLWKKSCTFPIFPGLFWLNCVLIVRLKSSFIPFTVKNLFSHLYVHCDKHAVEVSDFAMILKIRITQKPTLMQYCVNYFCFLKVFSVFCSGGLSISWHKAGRSSLNVFLKENKQGLVFNLHHICHISTPLNLS